MVAARSVEMGRSLWLLVVAAFVASSVAQLNIHSFELSDVKIATNTFQAKAAASNMKYLMEVLDVDRLLWSFRKTAGLPTPGTAYQGSWEDPGCELRGHFVGHYLSALSFVVQNTGDTAAKARLDMMIAELGKVQDALGGGYLSAFPAEHFDRVENLKGVWAPYYVIHKIMAGLLDAHTMGGNGPALKIVVGMADYHHARSAKVVEEKGMDHWVKTLETEFGGMNDIMYRLYRITKKPTHLALARWFDKPRWYSALVADKDPLPYQHANTHLAQVVGFAERADATNDEEARGAVTNFFNTLTSAHSYSTGGSNAKEFWQTANMLADNIVKQDTAYETQEICTQYNVLKLARSLFRWTGDVRFADFYERALLNGIMGVSRLTSDEVFDAESGGAVADGALAALTRQAHGGAGGAGAVSAARKLLMAAAEQHTDGAKDAAASAGAGQRSQEFSLGLPKDEGTHSHHHHHHEHSHEHDGAAHAHEHTHSEGHDGHAHGGMSHGHEAHGAHVKDRAGQDTRARRSLLGMSVDAGLHDTKDDVVIGHQYVRQTGTGAAGPSVGSILAWGTSDSGTSQALKGALPDTVNELHFFRSAAAGHADLATKVAASLAQEPSMLADPSGTPVGGQPAGTAHTSVASAASGVVPPYTRQFNLKHQDYWSFNMAHMPSREGAANVPGTPGSFLYLLPLGTGQSKRDNYHHWGYPLHSFWCCYGTAVESFAKLADSLYFYVPGKHLNDETAALGDSDLDEQLYQLYINQFVSSTLTWNEVGITVTANSTMYSQGKYLEASFTVKHIKPNAKGWPFILNVRIPSWTQPEKIGKDMLPAKVLINGQTWGWHDAESLRAGSYYGVTRRWKDGDVLSVRMRLKVSLSKLPDTRPQYAGLHSLMFGPFVMAGLTHDARLLELHVGSEEQLGQAVTEPPARPDELLGLTPSWNSSLYVRGDRYHAFASPLTDSGDALDATWLVRVGCHPTTLPVLGGSLAAGAAGASLTSLLARGGLRKDTTVTIEAMGMPGFYLGAQLEDDTVVIDQVESSSEGLDFFLAASASAAGAQGPHRGEVQTQSMKGGRGSATDIIKQFCATHSFSVIPGLDGQPDTLSFELAGRKGHYLSSSPSSFECKDAHDDCHAVARKGLCASHPERWMARCRLSCGVCRLQPASLSLLAVEGPSVTPAEAAAVSFRLSAPPAHRYPPGAKVVHGMNRRYLMAPLGNLVDERYTAYFDVKFNGEEEEDAETAGVVRQPGDEENVEERHDFGEMTDDMIHNQEVEDAEEARGGRDAGEMTDDMIHQQEVEDAESLRGGRDAGEFREEDENTRRRH